MGMTMKWMLGAVFAAALATPATVLAHAGHGGHATTVMGTVTARQDNRVELKTPEGKAVTVTLDAKTTFTRGKLKVDGSTLKVGERAVIEVAGEKDMTAKVVTLSPLTAAAKR
jgi:hypothetical protein